MITGPESGAKSRDHYHAWQTNKNYAHVTYYVWRLDPGSNGEKTYRAFVAKVNELIVAWRRQTFRGQDVITEIKHDRRYAGLPRSEWGVCDNTWIRPLAVEAAARNPEFVRWLQFRHPKASDTPDIYPPIPPSVQRAIDAKKRTVGQILEAEARGVSIDYDAAGLEPF